MYIVGRKVIGECIIVTLSRFNFQISVIKSNILMKTFHFVNQLISKYNYPGLWQAINILLREVPTLIVIIYSFSMGYLDRKYGEQRGSLLRLTNKHSISFWTVSRTLCM